MHTFFATSPRGLEGLLAREIRSAGVSDPTETPGGVAFEATIETAYRVAMWSRIAGRLRLELASGVVDTSDDLYELARGISWTDHVTPAGTFVVDSHTRGDTFPDRRFVALRVKDAVADHMRDRHGERPNVSKERPDLRVSLFIDGTHASVAVDMAGPGLHRRGYRAFGAPAPLRENLAAGLLLLAGWDELSQSGCAFLDPMCGSGTLLIEGAMIAAGTAPGLLRSKAPMAGWRAHDSSLWRDLADEAAELDKRASLELPIVGYDASPKALDWARQSLERAGMRGLATLEYRTLPDWPAPADTGLLAVNPPYGERMGEVNELLPTYATLGDTFKARFPGWTACVLSGNRTLDKVIGLRPDRRHIVRNGAIDCRWLVYPIVAGSLAPGREAEGERQPAIEFANRLRKRHKHLSRWASREGITCYRLYDADLPEYSLAVDVYGDWVHVQEYAAPKTIPKQTARHRFKSALRALREVLQLDEAEVFVKRRERQRGTNQYEKQDETQAFREVGEGGLRFWVNPTDYLDTGLFLDHRKTRHLIRKACKGKRFLNLFAYTGAASVYAAAGGAVATATVDMSKTYLDWAQRNLKLNDLDIASNRLIQADCREWLVHSDDQFDVIFLDPPTFSNSKRMEGTLDVQRDHVELINLAMGHLSPDGLLLFSTNRRRFKLDGEALASLQVEEITGKTVPEDFKRSKPHRCWRIRSPK